MGHRDHPGGGARSSRRRPAPSRRGCTESWPACAHSPTTAAAAVRMTMPAHSRCGWTGGSPVAGSSTDPGPVASTRPPRAASNPTLAVPAPGNRSPHPIGGAGIGADRTPPAAGPTAPRHPCGPGPPVRHPGGQPTRTSRSVPAGGRRPAGQAPRSALGAIRADGSPAAVRVLRCRHRPAARPRRHEPIQFGSPNVTKLLSPVRRNCKFVTWRPEASVRRRRSSPTRSPEHASPTIVAPAFRRSPRHVVCQREAVLTAGDRPAWGCWTGPKGPLTPEPTSTSMEFSSTRRVSHGQVPDQGVVLGGRTEGCHEGRRHQPGEGRGARPRGRGGSLESFYFAFGTDDVYAIADLPDHAGAAALAAAVGSSGATSSYETVVLLSPSEIDTAMNVAVDYVPPGS